MDYYNFTLYFIDYRCITHSKNHDPHVKYATAEDTAPSNLIEQSTTADALVKGFIKTRIKSPRASEKIKMSCDLHVLMFTCIDCIVVYYLRLNSSYRFYRI